MDRQLHSEEWVTVEDVAVRGRAFCGESLLVGESLAARFHAAVCQSSPTGTLDRVCEAAATLEGFFAVFIDATACEHTERSYLVSDGARSIPLYYDLDGSIVSDRGCTVQRAISGDRNSTTDRDLITDRDPITESELLLTRYVTGPETIWSQIYTTQPGEVVAIGESTRKQSPNDLIRRTYHEYWPVAERVGGDPKTAAKATLREGLETALDRVERIAEDRPIVVPLSGGYDSRLLAASLTERGRAVVGFTFGRTGHPDVEMSRTVATNLGIEWQHVSYTESEWRKWYHGNECRTYRNNAFSDSLPFLAEWPALRTLVDEDRVPTDALFCPGHTVTTPSERLPAFAGDDSTDDPTNDRPTADHTVEPSVAGLTEYILDTHYTLWDWENPTFRNAARKRIRRGLLGDRSQSTIADPDSAAAAYERWEWRGRMAAFTNGDLRAYENHGLDWWLPLWDPSYVRAWEQLSANYRRNRRLHIELAIELYRSASSVPLSRSEAAHTDRTLSAFDRSLSLLRHTPARQFTHHDGEWLPSFLVSPSKFNEPDNHPLAWYGAVDPELLDRFCEPPDFYSLRTLAETGYLDLSDSSSPIPTGKTITLPTADDTRE